jgi:hypothetical protein
VSTIAGEDEREYILGAVLAVIALKERRGK